MRGVCSLVGVAWITAQLAACVDAGAFRCESSDQCSTGTAQGYCELNGACSSEDDGCDSGWRYASTASGELASACVESCARDLFAGGGHTCVVAVDGTLWCFGSNHRGELGHDDSVASSSPRRVTSVRDVVQARGGFAHTCARSHEGEVWCWGDNEFGQLGHRASERESSPTLVGGLEAVELVSGRHHACAITEARELACWGRNDAGQLGDGSNESRSSPSEVLELNEVVSAAAGWAHTCSAKRSGEVHCWGDGRRGQLGSESSSSDSPELIDGLEGIVELGAGQAHTCALDNAGRVYCWGDNEVGQTGHPESDSHSRPRRVDIARALALAIGARFSCALLEGGGAACWGDNAVGQLGDGTTEGGPSPRPVSELDDALALRAGDHHACAIREEGPPVCWGDRRSGRLGGDVRLDEPMPTLTELPLDVVEITLGPTHACLLSSEGTPNELYCWGSNDQGQLGLGDRNPRDTPTLVDSLSSPIWHAVSSGHTCAVDGSFGNQTFCTGANNYAQSNPGDPARQLTRLSRVPDSTNAEVVFTGSDFSCEIRPELGSDSRGDIHCWGNDEVGQVSGALTLPGDRLPMVEGAGNGFACVGYSTGMWGSEVDEVQCWGVMGESDGSAKAYPLPEGSTLLSLGVGGSHFCITTAGEEEGEGATLCAGEDTLGQLGSGTPNGEWSEVPLPSPAILISAGQAHTCVYTPNATSFCWGDNSRGQLGDGSTEPRTGPVRSAGLTGPYEIYAGGDSTCARETDGYFCWGADDHGQLGLGRRAPQLQPEPISLDCP